MSGGADLWFDLKQRCSDKQMLNFQKLQSKHMEYIERVSKLPKTLPRIDWEYYKHNVADKYVDTVEQFKTAYENYKVPFPTAEDALKEIKKIQAEVEDDISSFKGKSNDRIRSYQELIDRAENHMPFEDMTWEDYQDIYPDRAPNFIKNPTFWPHTLDEQHFGPSDPDAAGHH